MADVDPLVLISLVRARPELWDKTREIHKDRIAVRNAWHAVCVRLKPDFDVIDDDEKNAFGKEVIRRWTNLRDSFAKAKKRLKDSKKAGPKAKRFKTYVFADQMQFLDKFYDSPETMDVLQPESDATQENVVEADIEPQGLVEEREEVPTSVEHNSNTKRVPKAKSAKYTKPDEIEIKILKALEADTPCAKMSFLKSLMPHLDKFDEQDFLQFQIGVLKVIESINDRKKAMAADRPSDFLRSSPVSSYQQFPTQSSSRPQEHSNHPTSLFPEELDLTDQKPVRSQISIANQFPLYLSHQHQASSPPQTPSCSNETNDKHPESAQFFLKSDHPNSPESEMKYSPAASVESSSADNIDFGTNN